MPDTPHRTSRWKRTSGVPASQARYLDDLSPTMSKALIRCHTLKVAVFDPKNAGVGNATIKALARNGLIAQTPDPRTGRTLWAPTAHGLAVITTAPPRLLAADSSRGYVTDTKDSWRDEPEAIDAGLADIYASVAQDNDRDARRGEVQRRRDTLARQLASAEAQLDGYERAAWDIASARRSVMSYRAAVKAMRAALAELDRELLTIDRAAA